jgi:serine/threonine-protein kinase
MALKSTSALIGALRAGNLLRPEQLNEVVRRQEHFPEPRALAQKLLARGWITTYQANRLLQGRGAELVRGPYLLLERIGQGGMGEVFKARHLLMNRVVALKAIHKQMVADPAALARFRREIQAAARLSHPNIVVAHDAAQIGDLLVLVMEYVEGIDLHRLVQKNGPLPSDQACDYIRQAALGLQHAHERGLVHRDIKPSNLLVTTQGVVKVLDLGLARTTGSGESSKAGSQLTGLGTVVGTADYMAPEQALDAHHADIRADIYSLGCTLYFLFSGRPPFPNGSLKEKLYWHEQVEPQAIETVRSDLPPALRAVLRKMMAKRLPDRFQTPAEVAHILASFSHVAKAVPVMATVVPVARVVPQASVAAIPATPVARPAGGEARGTLSGNASTAPPPIPVAQARLAIPEHKRTGAMTAQQPMLLVPGNPKKKAAAQVKEEMGHFSSRGMLLCRRPELKKATLEYGQALKSARDALAASYQDAIEEYAKLRNSARSPKMKPDRTSQLKWESDKLGLTAPLVSLRGYRRKTYIQHAGFEGRLRPVTSDEKRLNATFELMPGLNHRARLRSSFHDSGT